MGKSKAAADILGTAFGPSGDKKIRMLGRRMSKLFGGIGKDIETMQSKFDKLVEPLRRIAFQSQITFGIMAAGLQRAIGLANPMAITRFQWAMADLGAVIGRTLLPAMERATKMVRKLADWYLNLGDQTKGVIAAIAKVASGVVAFNAIAPIAINMIGGMTGAANLLVATLGPLGTIGTALVAAFSATTSGGRALAKVFDGLKSALSPVLLDLVFLGKSIAEFFGAFAEILAPMLEAVGSIARLLAPAFAKLGFVLEVVAVPFKFFAGVLRATVEAFKWFADAIEWVVEKLERLHNAFASVVKFISFGLVDMSTEVKLAEDLLKFGEMFGKQSSVGAAAGRASFTDIAGIGRQATINALQAGKNDPAKQTAASTAAMQKDVSFLKQMAAKWTQVQLLNSTQQSVAQAAWQALNNAQVP